MKKKLFFPLIVALSFKLVISIPVWADVPAPPANQIIGVNDGVFNDLAEADCRLCHENPDQFPVEDETIPNRHHLLVGSIIPTNTDAPFGIPGSPYECLSCHTVDTSSGSVEFLVERNCRECHIQANIFELTVHHRTDEAMGNLPQGPDCKVCHGSLVDNIEDGHYIPTDPPTGGTPKRSGGSGLPLNSEGNGAGACDYCHSTGTGDSAIPGIDSASGLLVYSNEDTHHMAGFWGGFGAHGFVCFWCHDFNLPFEEQIRVCENCHGRDSLHNIQTDSDGDGIINPGVELPGYGHLGDPDDCWGCHAFSHHMSASSTYLSTSSAPESGPIVPHINRINASVLTAGTESAVTLEGSAFTNLSGGIELTSNVLLTASDGSSIELIPDSINEGILTVTIPGTVAVDNYHIKAVKLNKFSNPVVISIKPDVSITDVRCNKKDRTVTITGENFGEKPEGTDEFINVEVNGQPSDIISWTDIEINANVSRCASTYIVTVNALFGSDTAKRSKGKVKKAEKIKRVRK